MMPSAWPTVSSTASCALARRRSLRILVVSFPCTRRASAQRRRPSDVFGPVESPPCSRQTRLPFVAGRQHCWRVLLAVAWHWIHRIRPPPVIMKKFFDTDFHLIEGSNKDKKIYSPRTSWTGSVSGPMSRMISTCARCPEARHTLISPACSSLGSASR